MNKTINSSAAMAAEKELALLIKAALRDIERSNRSAIQRRAAAEKRKSLRK